jgi:hypothetical protein
VKDSEYGRNIMYTSYASGKMRSVETILRVRGKVDK